MLGRVWEVLGLRRVLVVIVNCRVQDMNREVVKTDCATTRIPELDFEIPAFSQKGGGYGACAPFACLHHLQGSVRSRPRVCACGQCELAGPAPLLWCT